MRAPRCYVQGIGTAVPEHPLTQAEFLSRIIKRPYSSQDRRYLQHILQDSGIEKRNLILELSEDGSILYNGQVFEEQSTHSRNLVFATEVPALAETAARESLEASQTNPAEITHLISVSCTGFSNPGFDIHLMQALGLNANVQRLYLSFMGCYAALPALEMARAIVCSQRSAQVLIVCAELCSLHFHPHADKDALLSAALFADGVAAIHLSSTAKQSSWSISSSFSRLVKDSTSQMAWSLGNQGFDIRLSPYVSKIIGANLESNLPKSWINPNSRRRHWAVHPGGKSILDKVQHSMRLAESDLWESRSILQQFGNMSSATILFVLKELLQSRCFDSSDLLSLLAFGPGLTVVGCELAFREEDYV